jgi:hypothetical protein
MNITTGLPEWTGEYFQAAFIQRIDLSSNSWTSRPVNSVTLTASMHSERLDINGAYARLTEATLALLILLVSVTMYLNSRIRVNLYTNPNPIAGKCALICESSLLLSCFHRQNSVKTTGQCHLRNLRDGVVQFGINSVTSGHRNSWAHNSKCFFQALGALLKTIWEPALTTSLLIQIFTQYPLAKARSTFLAKRSISNLAYLLSPQLF